jgi:hypothetical protein
LEKDQGARGLIYIKTYKASSSTLEGISLSIAHNVARRIQNSSSSGSGRPCIHYNRHIFQDFGQLQYRTAPSLLWTMIRHPMKRDLSCYYFFHVSRKPNVTVTDDDSKLIGTIEEYKSFQTRYLLPWETDPFKKDDGFMTTTRPKNAISQMQHSIMDEYDFIGLVERMDESLAIMVLLWGLEPTDVIVLSAKQSGGYDDGGGIKGRCNKIVKPPPASPRLEEYMKTQHPIHHTDYLLWDAVNLSLDRTIQTLGKERVQQVVEQIRFLKRLAERSCQHIAQFPCNSNGELQLRLAESSCYVQDAGCGYKCVDKIMQRYKEGKYNLPGEKTGT